MKQIEVVAAIIRKGNKIFATQRGYGEWKDIDGICFCFILLCNYLYQTKMT